MKTPKKKLTQADCDAWNEKYKIGTPVVLTKWSSEMVNTTTRSEAFMDAAGNAVIHLEKVSGFYVLDMVKPAVPRIQFISASREQLWKLGRLLELGFGSNELITDDPVRLRIDFEPEGDITMYAEDSKTNCIAYSLNFGDEDFLAFASNTPPPAVAPEGGETDA